MSVGWTYVGFSLAGMKHGVGFNILSSKKWGQIRGECFYHLSLSEIPQSSVHVRAWMHDVETLGLGELLHLQRWAALSPAFGEWRAPCMWLAGLNTHWLCPTTTFLSAFLDAWLSTMCQVQITSCRAWLRESVYGWWEWCVALCLFSNVNGGHEPAGDLYCHLLYSTSSVPSGINLGCVVTWAKWSRSGRKESSMQGGPNECYELL